MYLQHHGNDRLSVHHALTPEQYESGVYAGPFADYVDMMHTYMSDLCVRADGVRICELEIRADSFGDLMEMIDAVTRLNGGVKLDVFIAAHAWFDDAWAIHLGVMPMVRFVINAVNISVVTESLQAEGYHINPARD